MRDVERSSFLVIVFIDLGDYFGEVINGLPDLMVLGQIVMRIADFTILDVMKGCSLSSNLGHT